MKRFIALMIIAAFTLFFTSTAFAVYDGEILFKGIPWDTDIISFEKKISSELCPETAYLFKGASEYSYVRYFDESRSDFSGFYTFKDGAKYGYEDLIPADDGIVVAGWPISYIDVQAIQKVENGIVFREADESRIISCSYSFDLEKITDGSLALRDLKDKLIAIYGDTWYETKPDNGNSKIEYVWVGDNTYIRLYALKNKKTNGFSFLTLEYGIRNTRDLINEIEHPEITIDLSSTDGL